MEAFVLIAEDLKFVASQFQRLHNKQLRHKFRFYYHQLRTRAACFIQVALLRFKKRRDAAAAELRAQENHPIVVTTAAAEADELVTQQPAGLAVYAGRLAASNRRQSVMNKKKNKHCGGPDSSVVSSLQKPEEPDFSIYEE